MSNLKEIQSLRNHYKNNMENNTENNETLAYLRNKPIDGYKIPTKIKASNNKNPAYSTYITSNEDNSNPYLANSQKSKNNTINNAYKIRSCLQCNFPLDKCSCSLYKNSKK